MTQSVYDAMIQNAKHELPNEACGILSGQDNIAAQFHPMTNIEKSPDRYLMDPKEQFTTLKEIRAASETLLGIFHSHVATEAYPSATDILLAYYPDVHYVLVSLSNPTRPVVRAFRIEEGQVREEPIQRVVEED